MEKYEKLPHKYHQIMHNPLNTNSDDYYTHSACYLSTLNIWTEMHTEQCKPSKTDKEEES